MAILINKMQGQVGEGKIEKENAAPTADYRFTDVFSEQLWQVVEGKNGKSGAGG